ncbi:uncharacterized protein B0T23DRAFT_353694 [Neurospora hispaniola]|uniref:Uncharacterized protein n=1 Tax=Neurospora hispaniola TaxID=588809 RepID=A0AAJ0ID89_9PEZI|nr:hypothetical protein B0T23DRAFT_353694 [Neurospora hispaniola]
MPPTPLLPGVPILARDSPAASSQAQGHPDLMVHHTHGDGLYVVFPTIRDVYSLAYRLMPTCSANHSLFDCLSVLTFNLNQHQHRHSDNNTQPQKTILAGMSSDSQLAALVFQHAIACGTNHLRRFPPLSPVINDAFSGLDPYMPLHFRLLHTIA